MTLKHLGNLQQRVESVANLLTLVSTGSLRVLGIAHTQEEWAELIADDEAEKGRLLRLPLEGRSPATRDEAVVRAKWVDALRKLGLDQRPLDVLSVRTAASRYKLPFRSPELLESYCKLSREDTGLLVPDYWKRGGPGIPRVHPRGERLLEETIADARKGVIPLTIKAVDATFHTRRQEDAKQNPPDPIPPFSYSTIYRRFKSTVSPYEEAVYRLGQDEADRRFMPTERRFVVDFPGGVTEFDDKDTGVFCVDEHTGLGWGRPWVTMGVDQGSEGYPVGRSFDCRPRSSESAIAAVVHSIEAKDLAAEGWPDADVEWVACGIPANCLFDNPPYNNDRYVSLNVEAGDPSWARAYTPRDKHEAEYHNKLADEFFKTLPGRRGVDDDPEAIKRGMSTAVLCIHKLKLWHLQWLLRDLARAPMADGYSRLEKYLEMNRLRLKSRMAPDVRRLRLLRCVPLSRDPYVWDPGGVRALGLHYQNCEAFGKFVRSPAGRRKVHILIDPFDITKVYAKIPDDDSYVVLECLEMEYAQHLTLYQHRLILKAAYRRKRTHPTLNDLQKARHELYLETEKLRRSTKIRERRVAARTGVIPTSTTQAVSELELAYDELDKVEMATGDEEWTLPTL